jgi:hypothetical protein
VGEIVSNSMGVPKKSHTVVDRDKISPEFGFFDPPLCDGEQPKIIGRFRYAFKSKFASAVHRHFFRASQDSGFGDRFGNMADPKFEVESGSGTSSILIRDTVLTQLSDSWWDWRTFVTRCRLSKAKHPIASVVGLVFAVGIFFVGLCSFAAGYAEYAKAKREVPEASFLGPSASIVALHWVFILFTTFMFGWYVVLCWHGAQVFNFYVLVYSMVVLHVVVLLLYVFYLIAFFNSPEFTASGYIITSDQWNTLREQINQSNPFWDFSATWEGQIGTCKLTSPVQIRSDNSVDESAIPVLDPEPGHVYHVMSYVNAIPDNQSLSRLDATQYSLARCAFSDIMYSGKATVEKTAGVDGFRDSMFVSSDGDVPWIIKRKFATIAAIFFSAILPAYRADAMPIVKAYITKRNVTVTQVKLDCAGLDHTCHEVVNSV